MKNKHLTLSDRNDIQIGIEQLKPFSAIFFAKLGKDPSTISKEVRRNRVVKKNSVTSNCETCPLLKRLLTFVMPVRKEKQLWIPETVLLRKKELSLIMKLSSQIREQVLP